MDRPPDCDLHPYFRDPDKARAILDACIAESKSAGKSPVRVVHGKGKGDFRKLIHSHLDKHPDVEGFVECDPLHGGSGATWVHIAGIPEEEKAPSEPDEVAVKKQPIGRWWRYLLYAILIVASFVVFHNWTIQFVMLILIAWIEYEISRRSD